MLLLSRVLLRVNAPLTRHTLAHFTNSTVTNIVSAQLGRESSCADHAASPDGAIKGLRTLGERPLTSLDKQLTRSSSSFLVMVASSTFSELSVVLSIVLLSTCMAVVLKAFAWLLVQSGDNCQLQAEPTTF